MALRDQLAYLSSGTRGLNRDELLDDWKSALERLDDLITKATKAFVDEHLLIVSRHSELITELSLGEYVVKTWSLTSGPKRVSIVPQLRVIAGWSGYVAVESDQNFTAYDFLRVGIGGDDLWYLFPRNKLLRRLTQPSSVLQIPEDERVALDAETFNFVLDQMFS